MITALITALKGIGYVLAGLVLLKTLWVARFITSGSALIAGRARHDHLARLSYLVDKLLTTPFHVQDMPSYLPDPFKGEWALVACSMTAAAAANLAFSFPDTQAEAEDVIGRLIETVLQPEFRAFDAQRWGQDALESLGQKAGHIGYLGHLNFMLAAYHLVGGQQSQYLHLFEQVSRHLHQSIESSPSLCAETYPGEIYLPDNAVVIASLALFERNVAQQDTNLGERWLAHAQNHFRDPQTDLFVFGLSPTGQVLQTSRGSGAAWCIFYLSYFAPDAALAQYWLLKEHCGKRVFPGITGVCEWPGCQAGAGDFDSGPLIFGLSPAASGFAFAGARLAQDASFLTALSLTAELAGFTVQVRGKRRYLVAERIAPLVGDAILLAMKTVTPWDRRFRPLPH